MEEAVTGEETLEGIDVLQASAKPDAVVETAEMEERLRLDGVLRRSAFIGGRPQGSNGSLDDLWGD